MPQAVVINPNTSPAMTAEIRRTAERVFQAPWTVSVAAAPAGPESLESWRDYQLAGVAVLPLLAEHPGADGYVLACFGDPGLYALKEICPAPVVGIAESAMSLALLLGARFGILAGMGRAVELMDSLVRGYGLESRYAGSAALNLRVLNFDDDRPATLAALQRSALELRARGADVLLLGCAGLTGFAAELRERAQMTVIDPLEAGCRALQAISSMGLSVSHAGIYAQPAPQRMRDLARLFSPEMAAILKSWEQNQP